VARPRAREKPRLIGFPREISAAAMLLLSGLGALALVARTPRDIVLGSLVLVVHLVTFDSAFYSIRSRDAGLFATTLLLNATPYIIALIITRISLGLVLVLGIALVILAIQIIIENTLGAGSEPEYVFGALVPVLPALTIPALLGLVNRNTILYWVLLSIYAVATAAYIESKLPWRNTSPRLAMLLLAPAWIVAIMRPCTSVALIEPTLRYTIEAVRPRKIERTELKSLGRTTLARLLLFATLSLITISTR